LHAPDLEATVKRTRTSNGFTLVEVVVVLTIMAVLASLAYVSIARQSPRASLATSVSEIQSLIHQARQSALASGQDVAVMIFPNWVRGEQRGRIVVYRDGDFGLFSGGVVDFAGYNPSNLAAGPNSEVLAHFDFPKGVTVGPATGMGAAAVLQAPLAGVVVNVACSFCQAGGNGAIRFSSSGQATFYGSGATLSTALPAVTGHSLSFTSSTVGGPRTLVVLSFGGAVMSISE
jgi:prepilin-type N-terminal cleavage/methylation domain-containing protein